MIVIPEPIEQIVVTRHDRQLRHAATAALADSKYLPLRGLRCSVSEGVIVISGTVPSFYLKQLAQAAVMQIEQVGKVRNLVEVSDESPVLIATSCDALAPGAAKG
jgi:osmotically-inducible protein OsmY